MIAEELVVVVVVEPRHAELERRLRRGEAVEGAVRIDDLGAHAVAVLVDQALRHVGSAGAVEHATEVLAPLTAPVAQHVVLVERVGRLQRTGWLALDDDVVPSIDLRQAGARPRYAGGKRLNNSRDSLR